MPTCRLCNHPVKQFLRLGNIPLPEEFRSEESLFDSIRRYPVGLSYCPSCFHVQLSNIVSVDLIYKKNYFYDYSVTQSGRLHWQSLCDEIVQKYRLTKHDLVVDIGSNTGTLLAIFNTQGFRILGVDPAPKLASIAKQNGIPTEVGYFTPSLARRIGKKWLIGKLVNIRDRCDGWRFVRRQRNECTDSFNEKGCLFFGRKARIDEFGSRILVLLVEVPSRHCRDTQTESDNDRYDHWSGENLFHEYARIIANRIKTSQLRSAIV